MTDTIEGLCRELGLHWRVDDTAGKVSLIGAGMKSHPGVAAKMFQTLAEHDINVRMIATSPIKVSCVIARERWPRPWRRCTTRSRPRSRRSQEPPMPDPRVAVVGATGAVGPEVLAMLAERALPRLRGGAVRVRPLGRHAGAVRRRAAGGAGADRGRARGLRPGAVLGRRRHLQAVRARGGRARLRRGRQVERVPHGSRRAAGGARGERRRRRRPPRASWPTPTARRSSSSWR